LTTVAENMPGLGGMGEVVLCPNCLRENDPTAHFCRHCVTPLTAHAATDPVKSITAEMDTLAKAAKSPRTRLVLVGMWLLMTPWLAGAVAPLLAFLGEERGPEAAIGVVFVLTFAAVVGIVPTVLLVKTMQHFHWEKVAAGAEEESLPGGWEAGEWEEPPSEGTSPPEEPREAGVAPPA
jgi:hypothetical protein